MGLPLLAQSGPTKSEPGSDYIEMLDSLLFGEGSKGGAGRMTYNRWAVSTPYYRR